MSPETSLSEKPVELPRDFADHVAAICGPETPPETLEEFFSIFASQVESSDQAIKPEDLYADNPTRHEVQMDDQIRYTPCVLDALEIAAMESRDSVTVRSVDPITNRPVTFEFRDDGLKAEPVDAVISFGITSDTPELKEDESLFEWIQKSDQKGVTGVFCQYINAFESSETYEQWASDTDGLTVQVPSERMGSLLQRFNQEIN